MNELMRNLPQSGQQLVSLVWRYGNLEVVAHLEYASTLPPIPHYTRQIDNVGLVYPEKKCIGQQTLEVRQIFRNCDWSAIIQGKRAVILKTINPNYTGYRYKLNFVLRWQHQITGWEIWVSRALQNGHVGKSYRKAFLNGTKKCTVISAYENGGH